MSRRHGVALLAIAVLLQVAPAAAQTSFWDRVKDPNRARADIALEAVEREIYRAAEARPGSRLLEARFLTRARVLLRAARYLDDPRLQLLEGRLFSDSSDPRKLALARDALRAGLHANPPGELAASGWLNLGVVSAKLGDPVGEHAAYTQALDLAWESTLRANLLLNRGESKMVLGQLRLALEDYKEAARLSYEPSLQALAYWGQGIVEERLGDLPSALRSVALAARIHPGALDSPGVFFVPRYDLHYYKALTFIAQARSARTAGGRASGWKHAADQFSRYLAAAEPDKHRYVGRARRHRRVCRRRQAEAEKQRAAEEKRPAGRADQD